MTAALEQRLADAYAEQSRHYDAALRVMREKASVDIGRPWVSELQASLQKIADLEATMADDKRAWQQSGHRPGEVLRGVLDGLAGRIRQLAEHVDHTVAELTAKREEMMPELDGIVRQRRMLHAYDQCSKPAGS